MFKFLDGKKTLIGVIVAVMPDIIQSVGQIIAASGADTSDYTKVAGGILAVLGMLHKLLKSEPEAK